MRGRRGVARSMPTQATRPSTAADRREQGAVVVARPARPRRPAACRTDASRVRRLRWRVRHRPSRPSGCDWRLVDAQRWPRPAAGPANAAARACQSGPPSTTSWPPAAIQRSRLRRCASVTPLESAAQMIASTPRIGSGRSGRSAGVIGIGSGSPVGREMSCGRRLPPPSPTIATWPVVRSSTRTSASSWPAGSRTDPRSEPSTVRAKFGGRT